jgi:hypothetical protein
MTLPYRHCAGPRYTDHKISPGTQALGPRTKCGEPRHRPGLQPQPQIALGIEEWTRQSIAITTIGITTIGIATIAIATIGITSVMAATVGTATLGTATIGLVTINILGIGIATISIATFVN